MLNYSFSIKDTRPMFVYFMGPRLLLFGSARPSELLCRFRASPSPIGSLDPGREDGFHDEQLDLHAPG